VARLKPDRIILREGGLAGLVLAVCACTLAVLGLAPAFRWIPELLLVGTGLVVPLLLCGAAGYRADRASPRMLAGPLAGGLAGLTGGAAGGLAYLAFGKPMLNIPVGLLLGAMCGTAVVGSRTGGIPGVVADGDLAPYHSGRGLHIGSSYQSVLSTYGNRPQSTPRIL